MKKILSDVFSLTVLFLSLAVLFALIRTNLLWGDVCFEQILVHVGQGVSQAGKEVIKGYLLWALLPAFVLCIVLALLINKNRLLLAIAFLCLIYPVYKTQLISFLIYQNTPTALYEDEYVDPAKIDFHFPDKKRNLIVLYMESMEKDYANPELVGQNLLPNLSKLAEENISFDGFHQLENQDYTIAAMVSSFCSVPFRYAPNKNYTVYNNFLPQLVCYPTILEQHGYKTYFLKGAGLEFARTGIFLTAHGFKDIVGREEMKESYGVDWKKFQGTSWGLRDRNLFNLAKQRLSELAASNQPFLFSLLTLDTHGPDIYLDKQCPQSFNDDRDVIFCADTLMAEFIDWIKQQDFYKNTTVVILGDHIYTGNNPLYPKHENREIVNIILNPSDTALTTQERKWTTFDLAPTILQAIGVDVPDGKFGLGRSLFSPNPTLREKMGQKLDVEIMKSSKIYDAFNTIKTTFKPLYNPYPAWNTEISDNEAIRSYASFAEVAFNAVWADTLSFTLPPVKKDNITLDIRFRILFLDDNQRTVKIFANKHPVADWVLEDKIDQPIYKKITIPGNIIDKDDKLLLEIKTDGFGYTPVGIGLGIERLNLRLD